MAEGDGFAAAQQPPPDPPPGHRDVPRGTAGRHDRRPAPDRTADRAASGDGTELRIGDAERDAAEARLRVHFAAGRIDLVEFEERIGTVYAATRESELRAVLADLPPLGTEEGVATTTPRSTPTSAPTPGRTRARRSLARRAAVAHAQVYGVVIAVLVVIWLLTTPGGHFWPVWPALGWGSFVAMGFVAAGASDRRADDRPEDRGSRPD